MAGSTKQSGTADDVPTTCDANRNIITGTEETMSAHAIPVKDKERMEQEFEVHEPRLQKAIEFDEKNREKLSKLLVGEDGGEFDSAYYPILVTNEPSKQISEEELDKSFGFIGKIHWKAVLDCDPNSNSTGICKYAQGKSKHQMKILSTDAFKNTEERDVSSLGRSFGFPEEMAYFFPNGRLDVRQEPEEKLPPKKWRKARSKAVKETVSFFRNPKIITAERAAVIFLLRSDIDTDMFVMSQIFDQFYISESFQLDNFTILAEDDEAIRKFVDKLDELEVVEKEEIESRCLGGVSWQEINAHMCTLVGSCEESLLELPMSPRGSCELPTIIQHREWTDISVLARNMCENSQKINPTKFEKDMEEAELKFYRGHSVEWLNFYSCEHYQKTGNGSDHVLQRNVHSSLMKKIDDAIKKCDSEDDIELISIYHEPGSGGTTVAKHALWHLRKKVRCAVIQRFTKNTAKQVTAFRNYGYSESDRNRTPVVLLIDNADTEILNEFMGKLDRESNCCQDDQVAFVLLRCVRTPNPQRLKEPCVLVHHKLDHDKLDKREQTWFEKKMLQLERKRGVERSADRFHDHEDYVQP